MIRSLAPLSLSLSWQPLAFRCGSHGIGGLCTPKVVMTSEDAVEVATSESSSLLSQTNIWQPLQTNMWQRYARLTVPSCHILPYPALPVGSSPRRFRTSDLHRSDRSPWPQTAPVTDADRAKWDQVTATLPRRPEWSESRLATTQNKEVLQNI